MLHVHSVAASYNLVRCAALPVEFFQLTRSTVLQQDLGHGNVTGCCCNMHGGPILPRTRCVHIGTLFDEENYDVYVTVSVQSGGDP